MRAVVSMTSAISDIEKAVLASAEAVLEVCGAEFTLERNDLHQAFLECGRGETWANAAFENQKPHIKHAGILENVALQYFESFRVGFLSAIKCSQALEKSSRVYGPLITGGKAADLLRVDRSTVSEWIRAHKMIGWKSTGRSFIVPREQIKGEREIYLGIAKVIERCEGDHELAWWYLNTVRTFGAESVRPIEWIKEGSEHRERAIRNAGLNEGGL